MPEKSTFKLQVKQAWHTLKNSYISWIVFLEGLRSGKNAPGSRFLFYYASWSTMFLYVLFHLLANFNPLQIMIPFSLYDYQENDLRSRVVVFVSDGNRNVYPVNRAVMIGENPVDKIKTLVREVGQLAGQNNFTTENENEFHASIVKLPDLHQAIRAVWIRDSYIVIDLHESVLKSIFEQIKIRKSIAKWNSVSGETESESRKNTKEEEIRIKNAIMESAYLAIEQTLFANFSKIQEIHYKTEGQKAQTLSYTHGDVAKR